MTRCKADRRGGVRGGEAGPRPRMGWSRLGLWPLSLAAGRSGLGQAGASLPHLPALPGPRLSQQPERTVCEAQQLPPPAADGWTLRRENEEAALGPVSKSQPLGTPGGSSCSQPGPRATPGGSRCTRNSEDRKSEMEVGPFLGPCLRKHSQGRKFVFLQGKSSSLPSHPPLYHHTLQLFRITKGRGRWDEGKSSLFCLPPFQWYALHGSEAAVNGGNFHPFAVKKLQEWDRISD